MSKLLCTGEQNNCPGVGTAELRSEWDHLDYWKNLVQRGHWSFFKQSYCCLQVPVFLGIYRLECYPNGCLCPFIWRAMRNPLQEQELSSSCFKYISWEVTAFTEEKPSSI